MSTLHLLLFIHDKNVCAPNWNFAACHAERYCTESAVRYTIFRNQTKLVGNKPGGGGGGGEDWDKLEFVYYILTCKLFASIKNMSYKCDINT